MPDPAPATVNEEWFLNGGSGRLTGWRATFPTTLLFKHPDFLPFLQQATVATKTGLTGVYNSVHGQLLARELLTVKPSPDCFAEPYMGPTPPSSTLRPYLVPTCG